MTCGCPITVTTESKSSPPEGKFIQAFGKEGSGNEQFKGPSGITISGGNLYVTEVGNNRVQELTTAGKYVPQFGKAGSGSNNEFDEPRGITVESRTGDLYVSDTGNNRVQEFTSAGKLITKFGSAGFGAEDFLWATGPSGQRIRQCLRHRLWQQPRSGVGSANVAACERQRTGWERGDDILLQGRDSRRQDHYRARGGARAKARRRGVLGRTRKIEQSRKRKRSRLPRADIYIRDKNWRGRKRERMGRIRRPVDGSQVHGLQPVDQRNAHDRCRKVCV